MSETWERAKRVFHEASALPAPERAGFLDTACEGEPELRADVEAGGELEPDRGPRDRELVSQGPERPQPHSSMRVWSSAPLSESGSHRRAIRTRT